MTSLQMPSRIAMPCPFGGFGDNNITPISPIAGNDVNFVDGFPSSFEAPTSTGGRFVTRKEMNAIGNLASRDLFYHKCGGLNTWDTDFCIAIGGYPKGAVLEFLVGNDLRKVISLTDNNKVCFSGNPISTSQSQMGIVSGFVDNINWRYLDKELAVGVFYSSEFWCEGTYSIVNVFESPTTGILDVKIENANVSSDTKLIGTTSSSLVSHISDNIKENCVIIKDITNGEAIDYPRWNYYFRTPSNTWLSNDWEIAHGNVLGTNIYITSTTSTTSLYGRLGVSDLSVKAGHKYAIAVGAGSNIFTLPTDTEGKYSVSNIIYTFSGKISLGIK